MHPLHSDEPQKWNSEQRFSLRKHAFIESPYRIELRKDPSVASVSIRNDLHVQELDAHRSLSEEHTNVNIVFTSYNELVCLFIIIVQISINFITQS